MLSLAHHILTVVGGDRGTHLSSGGGAVLYGKRYPGGVYSSEARAQLRSIVRLSYRRGFCLHPYGLTSDAGWGCMIRAAQSLMARALVIQRLGLDWRVDEGDDHLQYCDLIRLFLDYPGSDHIYGLQNFVSAGMQVVGKLPGEWFGGHSVSLVLRDLASVHYRRYKGGLQVFVPAPGNVINLDEVESLCSEGPLVDFQTSNFDPLLNVPRESAAEWKCGLILLLPLRLGATKIANNCVDELCELLTTPECLGFIGGTPNHALYIVGTQEEKSPNSSSFVCIDPHSIEEHPCLSPPFPSESLTKSIHSDRVRLVNASSLDPSLTIGFFFPSRSSFLVWSRDRQVKQSSNLFTVQMFASESALASSSHAMVDEDQDGDEEEGYVFV